MGRIDSPISPVPDRVLFMGSDPIALPLLDWLWMQSEPVLSCIVSQPDRPRGRGRKLQPNAISSWALERGVELLRPEKPDASFGGFLRDRQIDLVLVMAYGHILKQELLGVPPRGFVNFHASLLPRLRGASPIETAIATGETQTGVSLMRIVRRMDAGAVMDCERVAVALGETGATLRQKLAEACVPLLQRSLPKLLSGDATFVEQNECEATWCRKLQKDDGALDFSAPALELCNRINGLTPWPGCFIEFEGVRIKVQSARAIASENARPGLVCGVDSSGLAIGTGDGMLQIRELQRPGGRMLPAQAFVRGFEIRSGMRLESTEMPPLVSDRPWISPTRLIPMKYPG